MQVRVNAATSVDGKLASREREQLAISGPADFDRVDALRAAHDAIMVGVGTVLADDPSLTCEDGENPVRVIADSRARTPTDATVLDGRAETVILVSDAADSDRVDDLVASGATVLEAGSEQVDLATGLSALEERGLGSLLVEGGGEIVFSLFATDLVDELSIYVGSMVIGGREAPTLADGTGFTADYPALDLRAVERIDDGVLLEYDVEN
jgi:2,5-diamino-6-(ribosylamino)-4(3H)-pyrimidinone 5'-phosphate reductase